MGYRDLWRGLRSYDKNGYCESCGVAHRSPHLVSCVSVEAKTFAVAVAREALGWEGPAESFIEELEALA